MAECYDIISFDTVINLLRDSNDIYNNEVNLKSGKTAHNSTLIIYICDFRE